MFSLSYVLVSCLLQLPSQTNVEASHLFKDQDQVKFVESLSEYYITQPRFSLIPHIHLHRLSWKTIHELRPDKFYVKTRFNNRQIKLELHRNAKLLRENFVMEMDTKIVRPKKSCYYSGRVLGTPRSRVALSVCGGLKGWIMLEDEHFLIEPMRNYGAHYLHLVYPSTAELNSTHNPMRYSSKLQCSTTQAHGTAPSKRHVISKRSNNDEEAYGASAILPPNANIKLLIVVDRYMVEFHGNQSIQDYVLTMMNMVSDMYNDPSLGVTINIEVSKILVLHEDPKGLEISHNGDKTLLSFCEWQFMQSLKNNGGSNRLGPKYNIALLLTRKDVCANSDHPCGTIGLAYIGGTCTTNRKCAVVEDIGLNTAFTIAHELGHNLGMTHDGLDNNCKTDSAGFPHMMASQWPLRNHIPLKWSSCSMKRLQEFLSSYKSYCVREDRSSDQPQSSTANMLPGQLYDANTQCRQQYGGVARHCPFFKTTGMATEMCRQLWCEIEEENECVSKLDPAAKGTACSPGKWCMYGACVNNTGIPDSVDGGWSQWKNWTRCSRSCGVGVQYKERTCDNPSPENGGRYCVGEGREYITCNTKSCPEHSEPIRLSQCKQYNNRSHIYIPVHSDVQPCALHCRPQIQSAHYSVKFQPKVIDGTPCRKGYKDICIDGQCQKLGCDLQLNSKLHNDVCGVCGGKGDTCNLIEGEFTQPLGRGYVNAVDIPEGARNVFVQEVKPCASFLALKNDQGSYHVNGNWTIGLPGEYNVNGTVVHYKRIGTLESFWTDGPTRAKLHFMVLFQDFNFGVKYKYVLPLNISGAGGLLHTRRAKYKGSFGWMQGGTWQKCSKACGGGITTRSPPRCLHMYQQNITLVPDELCEGAKMPPSQERVCNPQQCEKVYFVTPWTECSKTCGLGRKKRSVTCKRQLDNGSFRELELTQCPQADRPVSIQTCVLKACYLSWTTAAWSKCRGVCNQLGYMYRSVSCPIRGACLESARPPSMRRCKTKKCDYSWRPDPWSACSKKCGYGLQVRRIRCREDQTYRITAPARCKNKRLPPKTRRCRIRSCTKVLETNKYTESLAKQISIPKIRAPRSKAHVPKSAEIVNTANCQQDRLEYYCKIKLIIARMANSKPCQTESDRQECCATCKRYQTENLHTLKLKRSVAS